MNEDLKTRLEFTAIDEAAKTRLRGLQSLLQAELPKALDAFYAQMRRFPEASRFFSSSDHMGRAHAAQLRHWKTIASADYDDRYVAAVQTVGETHARIGLEPRWYIGGYALVADGLIRAIVARGTRKGGLMSGRSAVDPALADDLVALTKAMLLDMDYAISVYLEAAEHARKEAERAAIARERELVIGAFGSALARLADGDLTHRLTQDLPAEYEQLRTDFNTTAEQLKATMEQLAEASGAVQSGAAELSVAADALSRRTEQQAASLEETAAALDEITATVRGTAENAGHARDVVTVATTNAQKSGEVVRQAITAMNEIEGSSKQISQIIGVIDEIAFQTNLLALNAGVEAARAGEAGRGFAVVASEVRALAQRSAEAAKEIKTLISASSEQVGSGVSLVRETGGALQTLAEQIGEINAVVRQITSAAEEQATGLAQVNTAVNQMDQMTQQNAAMVEQTTAAGRALTREADTLNGLVGRFDIGAAQAARQRSAPPSRPPAAVHRAMRGGAALKLEETPKGEPWEDF